MDLPCLIEMIERMPRSPKHRNFCTLVLPNKPVHVYLDFDAGADAEKPHKQAMYLHVQGKEADVQRELRQRFSAYFQQVFNREPNLSGMHWQTASCTNKFSLHAHITTEALANIDHLKVFMTGLSEYIVQQPGESCFYLRHPNQHNEMEVVSLMDAGVYTKNRCFRLIECCKPGKQHLKWLADPVTGETEPPSTAKLIFRGLISHSIDVAPESYLSMNVSNGIKKKTKQSESRTCNGLKSLKAQENCAQDLVSLSDEKRAIVQTLLRSDRILGSQTKVATCNIRSYGKKWSVVGQCRAATAWCAVQTMYASVGASVKPQIHKTAVTNFSITTTKVKVWDWKCGFDKSKVVLWSAKERAVVIKLLRGSPSAAAAGHRVPSSDESESASESAADVDTTVVIRKQSRRPPTVVESSAALSHSSH